MPYPGEHSARLKDPKDFSTSPEWSDGGGGKFRRTLGGTIYGSIAVPKTVGIIWGKMPGAAKKGDPPIPQALRFDVDSWTEKEVKDWLEENNINPILFEPASSPSEEALLSIGENIFIQAPSGEFSRVQIDRPDGKPKNQYWKEIIREGSWIHPLTNKHITVGREHLGRLFSLYYQMREAGLKVPINADHSKKAEDGAGYCVDLKLEEINTDQGPKLSLLGLLELGDSWIDKINQGDIQDVSAGIDDRPDGHGNLWRSVLDHVALTRYPVIEDQLGFVKLSAFILEREEPMFAKKETEGDQSMNQEEMIKMIEGLKAEFSVLKESHDETLKVLEEKEKALQEKDEKISSLEAEELQRSKEILLSVVDQKGLLPAAGDQVKALVEELYKADMKPNQASVFTKILSGLIEGVQLGILPKGKETGSEGSGDPKSFSDQDLSEYLENRV